MNQINMITDSKTFEQIETEITAELKKREYEVLMECSILREQHISIHSLHGTIGLNKSRSLDLVHGAWTNHEDYIASWLSGLKDIIQSGKNIVLKDYMKIDIVREYILFFLERDFYRHYKVRIKAKPQENLWSIWFGSEQLFWGLLIAPRFIEDNWENKPALVRKVEFKYWSVGHVMTTGIVDPENNKIISFRDIEDFLTFYESILKRVSNSIYEKAVFDFYCEYIRNSQDPFSEPFLIPEFRYEGINQKHKYRLDFTILNSETGERIGFELSPQSTHMAVEGIRSQTQVQMNEGLLKKWNKEMDKRNSYFQQYGINIITFTDDKLADMTSCNNQIDYYLSKRNEEPKDINKLIQEIITL